MWALVGNQAEENGGAIYLDDENKLSILNTTFSGGVATNLLRFVLLFDRSNNGKL